MFTRKTFRSVWKVLLLVVVIYTLTLLSFWSHGEWYVYLLMCGLLAACFTVYLSCCFPV